MKKYARAYLLPYIVLAGCNLFLQAALTMYAGEFSFKQWILYIPGILYGYGNKYWMPMCTPIWFLQCIFLCKIGFQLITRAFNKKGRGIAILVCAGISYCAYQFALPQLPWNLWTALMGIGFMWIGYQWKVIFCEKQWLWVRILCIAITVFLFPAVLHNADVVDMNMNRYGNLILFLIGALGGSVFVMEIARLVQKVRFLSNVFGQHTILILGFNFFVNTVIEAVYNNISYFDNTQIHWGVEFVMSVAIFWSMISLWKIFLRYRDKQKLYRV